NVHSVRKRCCYFTTLPVLRRLSLRTIRGSPPGAGVAPVTRSGAPPSEPALVASKLRPGPANGEFIGPHRRLDRWQPQARSPAAPSPPGPPPLARPTGVG